MAQQHLGRKRSTISRPHLLPQPSIPVPTHPTLQLQGAIGNRAVNKTIASQQNSDSKTLQFRGLSQELAGDGIRTAPIQAKLVIGQPGDRYEQEADRIASQVVNQIHAPQSSTLGETLQRHDKGTPQMTPLLQLSEQGSTPATSELEAEIKRSRGGGQPLAESIRLPMEQAFETDFSGVRVHTNAQADQLNRSIQAKAFTTRQDLFFRQGEYQPGSQAGQKVIAHELTHVVQQGGQAMRRSPSQKLEKYFTSQMTSVSFTPQCQNMYIQRTPQEQELKKFLKNFRQLVNKFDLPLEATSLTRSMFRHQRRALLAQLTGANAIDIDQESDEIFDERLDQSANEFLNKILFALDLGAGELVNTPKVSGQRKDAGRVLIAYENHLEDSANAEDITAMARVRGGNRLRREDVYTNEQRSKRNENFARAQQAVMDVLGAYAGPTMTEIIRQTTQDFSKKVTLCFWSGKGAKEAALANNPDGIVLENTIGSWFEGVNLQVLTGNTLNRIDLWATLSEIYAKKAAEYHQHLEFKGYVGIDADITQNIFNQIESSTMAQAGVERSKNKRPPHITWYVVESRVVNTHPTTGKKTWLPTGNIRRVPDRDAAVKMVELADQRGQFPP